MAMQRTANPWISVRFRSRPPVYRRGVFVWSMKKAFGILTLVFPGSSVVEQVAVNHSVAGSSPARGANA